MLGSFLTVFCNTLKNIWWSAESGRETWKMAGSSTDFLSGEDLKAILSEIKSDFFDESTESALMATETFSEMETEEPE